MASRNGVNKLNRGFGPIVKETVMRDIFKFYFNNVGLVTDDQGSRRLYIPWKHIHGIWKWMVTEKKDPLLYPGFNFDRQTAAYILANYEEAVNSGLVWRD
jgi:hypothetical protein